MQTGGQANSWVDGLGAGYHFHQREWFKGYLMSPATVKHT